MDSSNINKEILLKDEINESDRSLKLKIKQSLKDILVKAGNQGMYQKFILVIIACLGMFYSMGWFSLPYVFFKPDYMCEIKKGVFEECSKQKACSGQFPFKLSSGNAQSNFFSF